MSVVAHPEGGAVVGDAVAGSEDLFGDPGGGSFDDGAEATFVDVQERAYTDHTQLVSSSLNDYGVLYLAGLRVKAAIDVQPQ